MTGCSSRTRRSRAVCRRSCSRWADRPATPPSSALAATGGSLTLDPPALTVLVLEPGRPSCSSGKCAWQYTTLFSASQ
jgi:hypothetical protein